VEETDRSDTHRIIYLLAFKGMATVSVVGRDVELMSADVKGSMELAPLRDRLLDGS